MRFKVGDRVQVVKGVTTSWYVAGDTGVVLLAESDPPDKQYFIHFGDPAHRGIGKWWVTEAELEEVAGAPKNIKPTGRLLILE